MLKWSVRPRVRVFQLKLPPLRTCCVQCMKEAVDACRDVHAVLKKWLLSTTGRRLAAKRRPLGDKSGESRHLVPAPATQTC